ncbi:DUF6602 domain-containing protein [Entomomonas asaccharolytica]|uniref:DUF6602 domain-containing protein n=1 Tax=Entomomonas asaccharolytica TaxID=2785331 RepID=A0A974NDP8_9GAMM|nr:DUF6602 domain-containing protein [Entomomonas asaccharolytica]QQP84778.1 hypothetical protein JHT90_10235 [Entomomonas asaccharolytica]
MEKNIPPNFVSFTDIPTPGEQNFLDHYFLNIYNKLEADALLFNRKLPHTGLMGSENENAIGDVLRQFLPSKFGIDVNALVIDRFGQVSRQADIVIYDAENQANFFRKVHPIETVYAVIEVKTTLSATEAISAMNNLASVSELEFRPALTPYWETRTKQEEIHHNPPKLYIFAYRTTCESFETFARWFDLQFVLRGVNLRSEAPKYPEIRCFRVCALDQGVINMASSNGYVQRFVAEAVGKSIERAFTTTFQGQSIYVDPAKSLFLFLHRLWSDLQVSELHPGFDIRSYMSKQLDLVLEVTNDFLYSNK